jgi:hypothetical protein
VLPKTLSWKTRHVVTTNRLPRAWTKFCESEMNYHKMVRSIIKDLADEEEDGEAL